MKKKITIVGAGFVGSTAAHWIAAQQLGDIVLIDIAEGIPQGKALDLYESMPIQGSDVTITGTNSYEDTNDSDIVVVTAGIPRKPGMSRDDLLATNAKIMQNVCENIKKHSPNAILIIVSNPLDAMVYKAWKITGFPQERIMGMAGILDSTRFRTFIAEATKLSVKDISAMVLGGHGDTMVPLKRFANIGGIPLTQFLDKKKIDELVQRTQDGGAEIVKHLKTGSAYFAPGRAIAEMVESIVLDQKRVLPCAALCAGEYGAKDIFIGVPVVLGSKGMEKIIEIPLDDEEKSLMQKTINHVQSLIAKI